MQININMALREEICHKIQAGNISTEMFNQADSHCLGLLQYSVFPLWKASHGYRELMRKANVKDIIEFKERRGDNLKTAHSQLKGHQQVVTLQVETE